MNSAIKISKYLMLAALLVSQDCWSQPAATASSYSCSKTPAFAVARGISRPTISTADRIHSGLLMFPTAKDGSLGKAIQLPSWTSAGRLGPFVIDQEGNITVAPVPNVNTLENPPERQNWLYRVRSSDGELQAFAKIPVDILPSQQNPYGILGLAYDCGRRIIYASTVSGSTPTAERGKIVAIDATSGTIVSEFLGIDVIGIGTGLESGKPVLYIGKARSSDIYKIELDSNGKFAEHNAIRLFNFDQFNVLKARKIRIVGDRMYVSATEFYYNLVAQTEFEQPNLQFALESGKWSQVK